MNCKRFPISMKKVTSAIVVAVTVLGLLSPARPAGALTTTENFVIAVYEDFLLRGPDTDEMTWWTTYLASGSRSTMVSNILGSDEFEVLWVAGTQSYYLDVVDAEGTAFASELSALQTSGDYVATEATVAAGPEYFAAHGSTNTGYVEALFVDILLRTADPAGLAYWVGRLDLGTSTRAHVATSLIRSSEGASRRVGGTVGAPACVATTLEDRDSIPSGSYCIVLDRLAEPSGQTYWSGQLAGSGQLPALWTSLAASSEYFTNAQL